MENRAHAIAAGLFVIGLLIAAALTGGYLAGDRTSRTTYRVISQYPVAGLNVQGQVRFRGISVGRVTRIDLDPRDSTRIYVDVDVDSRYRLTKGTYAQLGMEGITGIAYVHLLDDGADKEMLAAGPGGLAEITMRKSDLDELFDAARGISKDAGELMVSVRELLNTQNQKNVAASLASIKSLAANLDSASTRLPGTLERADRMLSDQNTKNVAQTLSALNAASRQLPAFTGQLPDLAREARATAEKLGRLSEEARPFADEALGLAGDLRNDTVPRAQAMAESLERNAERLGKLAYEIEKRPESMLWGRPRVRPGPGEKGFE
jgi:phospholipid/cholesterol/gamma-HCH transport system substrate-binding protein